MKLTPPIAVVGMGGIFPGASNLGTFWQNIVDKVDTTAEVPQDRWIIDPDTVASSEPMPDKAYSTRACLITDFQFDPKGIDLGKDLLHALDPLHQMVLHAGRDALDSCAHPLSSKQHTGVILAAIALPTVASSVISRKLIGAALEEKILGNTSEKKNVNFSVEECLAARVTGFPAAILAAALQLGGGSYTLDAACASSLYAVKLACDELYSGRADAMLAGGVSRPDCLYTQIGFSQLRALSPSGRCAPFDQRADGLVVGEGAGILVLKRLDDAIRDNDHIHALIRGVGLSNDMRGNLLAPDSEGQVRAMQSAYKNAGWSPRDVDLIECHGAGTPVGDAVELQSLRSLWGESGWTQEQCAIGSVKSMIGHLLTAAGAAGMIKTILALKRNILPPSLNFNKAPEQSPLHHGPFRVQTETGHWSRRTPDTPLRAAVSAFGFGGINSHLLFEEWHPDIEQHRSKGSAAPLSAARHSASITTPENKAPAVAIIGMASAFGSLTSLRAFQEAIFKGESTIVKRPNGRWKGCDDLADHILGGRAQWGGFMEKLAISLGEFRIPPNEIPDMLVQHLLMLKIAVNAMKDAGFMLREDRPRMGAVIGIDFDYGATDFQLRWHLNNVIKRWAQNSVIQMDRHPGEPDTQWQESLQDALCPALTATRTLGALAGIIASRIARELCFGGPSFVVSNEAASGLKALEIGVRFLQQSETDAVLIGAVDLCGDLRNVITNDRIRPFAEQHKICSLDHSADGTLPGEGAAAMIIKRLDMAVSDGDRIYAVVRGIGNAGGVGIEANAPCKQTHIVSLQRSFQDAGVSPESISFFETHGSGNPTEDRTEAEALTHFFSHGKIPCAVGSTKPNIGHAGAAAGLASLVKTSLCLYQEIIPPLKNFVKPCHDIWKNSRFHLPVLPHYWLRDRKDGPRRACTGATTTDGNVTHVILDGYEYPSYGQIPETVRKERKRPMGTPNMGLFVVEGSSGKELLDRLDALNRHITSSFYRPGQSSVPAPTHGERENAMDLVARSWYRQHQLDINKTYAVSIVAAHPHELEKSIADAKTAVTSATPKRMNGPGSTGYSPAPTGTTGGIAFVFPGSGNHYVGMGRRLGVLWPDIFRKMDAETSRLKTQTIPDCFVPWRTSWDSGWEKDAYDRIVSDPLNTIFGQVVHGSVVANIMKAFNIKASSVIGYSLGESAGLIAMGAWPDREQMLTRILSTNLFTTELAGPCNAARKAWNVPIGEDVNWCVAVVNRSADRVQQVVRKWPYAKLLIVNTPDQCVVGGRKQHVIAAIRELGCESVFLDGVITVHCDAAVPASDAYKKLHLFATSPPQDVQFYSCALGRTYRVNTESAADSILKQAISGFNFVTLIEQAYRDGVRVFLEMGPHSSCTGMISRILEQRPHVAVAACHRDEDDYLTILKCLGTLIAERVDVDLEPLYGDASYPPSIDDAHKAADQITLTVGGKALAPASSASVSPAAVENKAPEARKSTANNIASLSLDRHRHLAMIDAMLESAEATADAHQTFLDSSSEWSKGFEKTFALQARLLKKTLSDNNQLEHAARHLYPASKERRDSVAAYDNAAGATIAADANVVTPVFDRQRCLEFATGSVARVLGPEFAVVDTYPVRVRLPDEPLMLVDRILSVEGEKRSLGPGRIVTEHDVLPDAWYLDGGHAPVCISVEAGQADLFLCSYLGIDHAVKGKRSYRLLDATVTFHRSLPRPGEVIRYEINIDHFVRQGDTYLFFFRFEGSIKGKPFISMFNGCAGFFTEEEVKNSGGIILTEEDTRQRPGKQPSDWAYPVPMEVESYDDELIEALREGNLAKCFGPLFAGIEPPEPLKLPGGRMTLIHRVRRLDPRGGRFGLGIIRAEADIHPDDWFLTCHFMDDMVMPGTLMYECCAHTLRIFIQRMGWVTATPDARYEPVPGVASVLKCRGPVTPETKHVLYDVEIKEIGYAPEPYVIADALMYADGQHIVSFKDISMKMTGVIRQDIEDMWQGAPNTNGSKATPSRREPMPAKTPLYDRGDILAFAVGNPSDAFGEPYKIFDNERFIARLPAPPYSFIDRVVTAEPEAWVFKPDGWVETEYDVAPDAWYFTADRTTSMPFCILLEIVLQPCGWLAAYMGSALRSKNDLKFRNLGGHATVAQSILKQAQTLTVRARATKVSEAAEMIIEHFAFQVLQDAAVAYSGETYFGFFSRQALSRQVGIRDAETYIYQPTPNDLENSCSFIFKDEPPLFPGDSKTHAAAALSMPATALRMIDRITEFAPNGGPDGLGFIRGIKIVDPDEWFFKAHFFQDPVWPGSLGIEAFLQLVKFAAINRWQNLIDSHTFQLIRSKPHTWTYRGQVIPQHEKVAVEAVITNISETPVPTICANGWLQVDGRYIYQMNNFGLQLVPADTS